MRKVSRLRWIAVTLVLAPLAAIWGCQPANSKEEMGTMIYRVPEVPGSEKSLPMPELDTNAESGDTETKGTATLEMAE